MEVRGAARVSTQQFFDGALYARLLEAAPLTGRCPVWVTPNGLRSMEERWTPSPTLRRIPLRDPAVVLAEQWPSSCSLHPRCLEPFLDGFPGMACPAAVPLGPIEAAVEVASCAPPAYLALVPVHRPADAPAAIGWSGMINRWDDVAGLCAVLRSWEDRFGVLLTRMDLATLELSVPLPALTEESALPLAAEHYAFCYDTFAGHSGGLRDYARTLVGARRWRFWWD